MRRLIGWIEPTENPAGAVYGTITVGALLAAEAAGHETYARTVAATAIALTLYWLAHAYAETVGQRLERHERLTARTFFDTAVHELAIVRGAAAPVLALLVAWLAGAQLQTAQTAALWTCAASIVVFEVAAGARARLRRVELLGQALMGATIGLGIIALKIVLH